MTEAGSVVCFDLLTLTIRSIGNDIDQGTFVGSCASHRLRQRLTISISAEVRCWKDRSSIVFQTGHEDRLLLLRVVRLLVRWWLNEWKPRGIAETSETANEDVRRSSMELLDPTRLDRVLAKVREPVDHTELDTVRSRDLRDSVECFVDRLSYIYLHAVGMAQHTLLLLPTAAEMDTQSVASDVPRKVTVESEHSSLVEEHRTVDCCRTQVWVAGVLDTPLPEDSLGTDYCRRRTVSDIEGNRS